MKGRNYWGNTLTRIALVVATVSIIVAVLPRNSGPQFRYDVGKPWMYGSLIAKFVLSHQSLFSCLRPCLSPF